MDEEYEYEVRHRAYELWVASGRPDGKHQQFWEEAEREIREHRRVNGGTPPPAPPEEEG